MTIRNYDDRNLGRLRSTVASMGEDVVRLLKHRSFGGFLPPHVEHLVDVGMAGARVRGGGGGGRRCGGGGGGVVSL